VPFVFVKKPHDHGKLSQEFHPVGTPYRGGMETRGGVVPPSRTRRFTMEQDCWDSRQRSSGGSPAQKWGHVGRQCGSCVENGDNRQKVFRIHPVGTPYRGGMSSGGVECPSRSGGVDPPSRNGGVVAPSGRGGVVAPSRTRRFTMEQGWWDSGQRSPGGSS
jgi:hypothetical protein